MSETRLTDERITRIRAARASGGGRKHQTIRRGTGETALPYAMVAPLLVFIGALALYPTVQTAYGAFVHNDALDPPNHFTGFGNFQDGLQQLAGPPEPGEHRHLRDLRGRAVGRRSASSSGCCCSAASAGAGSCWR